MTSPLRKKHPTTPANSPATTDSRWLFGPVALVAWLVIVGDASAVAELQWRRGGPNAKHSSAQAAPADSRSRSSGRVYHQDGSVRSVAYEAEVSGPSFAGFEGDRGGMRSVVVGPDKADGMSRSAQLQFRQPGTDGGSRYDENIRTPFGDEPSDGEPADDSSNMFDEMNHDDVPPLPPDALPSDELPPSNEDFDLPEPEDRQPAPRTRQPAAQPPRTFQPQTPAQLPRGRRGADPFERQPSPNMDDEARSLADSSDLPLDDKAEAEEFCSKELADLKASTLADVDLSITVNGAEGSDFPFECSIDNGTFHSGRCWCDTTYTWKASALCHKPLYFEDEALERYGHSWGPCCDPIVSGAHFFTKLPVLPYCMGVTPPCECMYALGHYRPGSCAPYMCDPIPISGRGALFQAGAVVGVAAALP